MSAPSSSEGDPGRGRLLGRFELLQLAGEGGMGAVYRARDPGLDRVVAVKLLRGPIGAEELQRFAREADAAAALRHPHVVQVHESGSWQGQPYLVMDWVEGTSLREVLRRRGQLPPREACALLAPVADALAAAHGLGIVHRDLKPENVLLAADGRPLLADFGLARDLRQEQRLTRTGEALGTPGYMAPEQAAGDRARAGPACDVFALGVLLYELISGVLPFPGRSALDLMRAVLEEEPASLAHLRPALDRRLEGLIRRCLEKEPTSRPSAEVVRDTLRALARAESAEEAGPGRAALLVAAGIALAGLAASAALILTERPAPTPASSPAPVATRAVPEPPEAPAPAPSPADWPAWYARTPDEERPPLPARLRPAREAGVYLLRLPDEQELELVWIPPAGAAPGLYLARYELTWGEYLGYLAASRRPKPTSAAGEMVDRDPRARPELPAVLTWLEAAQFCEWAGGRLPALAEWRRAAVGETPPDTRTAGFEPEPARQGSPGRSGLVRLADNLHEWVQDRLLDLPPALHAQVRRHPNYQDAPRQNERLLAGGSFLTGPSLEALSTCPLHSYLADSGCRLALDATLRPGLPELLWHMEAVVFEPTPQEARPVPHESAGRSYAQLAAKPVRRLTLVLPHLDLNFLDGPGNLPEAWGLGMSDFPGDWFALRATTRVELPAGRWRIVVKAADDGVRVWLDDAQVIDCWLHGVWKLEEYPERLTHRFQLAQPALVRLRVEHVELFGGAQLRVALERDE